jgi:hypothetical protein
MTKITHHEDLKNMVDKTLEEHRAKSKNGKIKYPITLSVVINKTNNEIIFEDMKKNRDKIKKGVK